MFVTHSSLEHRERKLFPMRKFMKSTMLRPVCEFPFCIINLDKKTWIFAYVFKEKWQKFRDFTRFNISEWMMIKSTFDSCFTNPRICGVTRRRGRFVLEEICIFQWALHYTLMNFVLILGKRYSCNQEKMTLF